MEQILKAELPHAGLAASIRAFSEKRAGCRVCGPLETFNPSPCPPMEEGTLIQGFLLPEVEGQGEGRFPQFKAPPSLTA
jgi:hypothetical protein